MGAVRAIERQGLDWVGRAPLMVEARATSTAPPEAVFAVLADHERWVEWFPAVKKVEVLGPAEGVGARRRVSIPGAVVEEEFIAWEPGVRWAFTGMGARPRFVRSLVEDCQLTPTAAGGTDITYAMHLDPPPALAPVFRLASGALRKNLAKALRHLAERAAAATD